MSESSFNEYRKHILTELVRLSGSLDRLQSITTSLAVEVGELKATNAVKAGFWGSVGGLFAAVMMTIILKGALK